MQPHVGQIVLYCLRPGQTRVGQSELAAIVTRVWDTRPMTVERSQGFKRLVKERKPDADGHMQEITREVIEQRMVPATVMAPPAVDLRIWVSDSIDPLIQQRVQAQSEAVKGHCWRPIDAPVSDGSLPLDSRKRASGTR